MINPIRLANEWRDSLLMTGLVAYAAADPQMKTIVFCIGTTITREVARILAWSHAPKEKVVGTAPLPCLSALHCAIAASITSCIASSLHTGIMVAAAVDVPDRRISSVALIVLSGLNLGTAAALCFLLPNGWRSIKPAYGIMWDWPRKRDGGGGETSKLSEGLSSWRALVASAEC